MDDLLAPQFVVERYFAAINERDWAALRGLLHSDFSLQVVAMGRHDGVDAALIYYQALLAGFSEGTDCPTRYLVSGNTVTVEIDFVGRTVEGRPVAFPAADVFDVSDGKIMSLSIWYDSLGVARQVKGRTERRRVAGGETAGRPT